MFDEPEFPADRIIIEGRGPECPLCGSSYKRKGFLKRRMVGCLSPRCKDFYNNKVRSRKNKLSSLDL